MSQKPPVAATEPAPAPARPRTLVLCFDGTSEQYSGYDTNAVKLFGLLKKDDFREQLCYYQSGVGTYLKPSMVSPIFEWCAKVLDEAFAIFLNDHVMDGYRFLMENYHAGDKICLFGFSRGAYTARAVAGMLHKVGLLPRDNQQQVPLAFKLYQNTSASGLKMAAGYKQTFCQNVQVDFMGCWETVDSVGVMMGRTLPFTATSAGIKTFRHAVALDERRVRFMPYLCEPKDGLSADILEVWFAGTHSDVGGGAVANGVARSLSDITLRWMVRQVFASPCDILFDDGALARAGIRDSAAGSPVKDTDASRGVNGVDALQPLHDELAGFSTWEPLELFPLSWSVQDTSGMWHRKFGFHLGKGRKVVDPQPKFHITVKERMKDTTLKYQPKAQYTPGTEVYVE